MTPLQVVAMDGSLVSTVAKMSMGVELPATVKGTHMSRFLESIQQTGTTLNPSDTAQLGEVICKRLEAESCQIAWQFPYFIERLAPVSGRPSQVNYEVELTSNYSAEHGEERSGVKLIVPVATLCPCSKEISSYGAHNQRGYVELSWDWKKGSSRLHFQQVIDAIETCGSAPLINLLKRPDEKFVTEQAYDNPVFVEDLIRNVVVKLGDFADAIGSYAVRVTNHESIHTHNAYAVVRGTFN